jgi:hypothetical protein
VRTCVRACVRACARACVGVLCLEGALHGGVVKPLAQLPEAEVLCDLLEKDLDEDARGGGCLLLGDHDVLERAPRQPWLGVGVGVGVGARVRARARARVGARVRVGVRGTVGVEQVREELCDVAKLVGLEPVNHRVLLGEALVEADLVRAASGGACMPCVCVRCARVQRVCGVGTCRSEQTWYSFLIMQKRSPREP